MLPEASTLLYALLGGVLPAVLWLLFWLREDKKCPEPRGLILLGFIAGMLAVIVVIPIEQEAAHFFTGTLLVVVWAIIEEVLKFTAAYIAVLRRCAVNEPIDTVIYMITVALGFAALENTLFLLSPIGDGFVVESILTGNLRFLGATLLHVLASASIGAALAFSFYHKRSRVYALWFGLILASTLHALFNFFILKSNGSSELLWTLFAVWTGIIILILVFERIKQIKDPRSRFIRKRI